MEKESKIIEPSICLPKDKELLETTEAVTVKFGAGQISLGTIYKRFQWLIRQNLDQDLAQDNWSDLLLTEMRWM